MFSKLVLVAAVTATAALAVSSPLEFLSTQEGQVALHKFNAQHKGAHGARFPGATAGLKKKMQKHAPSMARLRGLKALQTATAPAPAGKTLPAQCQTEDYNRTFMNVMTACGQADFPDGDSTAATYDTFCTGECGTQVMRFPENYLVCLPPSIGLYFPYIQISCEMDTVNNRRCGVTVSSIGDLDCDYSTQARCVAPCTWVQGSCEFVPTTAFLDTVCVPCVEKFMDLLDTMARMEGETMVNPLSVYCAQVDGRYCSVELVPLFVEMGDDYDLFNQTNASAHQLCSTRVKKQCVRILFGGIANMMRASVRDQFLSCVESATPGRESFCLFIWMLGGVVSNMLDFMSQSMCLRNANGLYCTALARETTTAQGACMATLVPDVLNRRQTTTTSSTSSVSSSSSTSRTPAVAASCSATCATEMTSFVSLAGCCLGVYDAMVVALSRSAPLPPGTPANLTTIYNAALPTPPPTSADARNNSIMWRNLQLCTGMPDYSAHLVPCMPAEVTPRNRTLRLRVAWTSLSSNTQLQDDLKRATAQDIAADIGVGEMGIIGRRLAQDSSTTLTLASGATSSGTTFHFAIRDDTQADTDAAAARFDSLSSQGDLTMSNARGVASSSACTDCTEPVVVGQDNSLAAPNPSSASGLASMIVAMLAVLALLL